MVISLSQRFVIEEGHIKDFQSDWVLKLCDPNDMYYICEKLNDLDDEKWEYRKKYNNVKTKLHKIHQLSCEK